MADSVTDFPYVTRLDIQHAPLEIIDVGDQADACGHKWFNQTLCQVNDSVVRMAVIEGEYHWHRHTGDDEFFYVIEGALLIDLDPQESSQEPERTVQLHPRQAFVVPKDTVHRTRAPRRTVVLMVENAGIIPTGN